MLKEVIGMLKEVIGIGWVVYSHPTFKLPIWTVNINSAAVRRANIEKAWGGGVNWKIMKKKEA